MDVVELRALFLGAVVGLGTTTVLIGHAVNVLIDRWRARRGRTPASLREPHTVEVV